MRDGRRTAVEFDRRVEQPHNLLLAADGAARHPAGHDLRHRREVGNDAVARLQPAWAPAEAGDHLVEDQHDRSGEHTSELQSLMRISYAVFCLKKKKN